MFVTHDIAIFWNITFQKWYLQGRLTQYVTTRLTTPTSKAHQLQGSTMTAFCHASTDKGDPLLHMLPNIQIHFAISSTGWMEFRGNTLNLSNYPRATAGERQKEKK